MRYSKSQNAGIGHLNLTLGARNVIWAFLFHFSFVSSASWLVLGGVMSARRQAVITLSRIVFLCNGWLRCAIPISRIRTIHLHEFFFISWAGSHTRDDCYVGRTHHSLQDKLKLIVCSMFTVPNVFGAWQRSPGWAHNYIRGGRHCGFMVSPQCSVKANTGRILYFFSSMMVSNTYRQISCRL